MARKSKRAALSPQALELIAHRFKVLSEPLRLRLIILLEEGEKNVSQLVAATGGTQANVSRHLQSLTEAGILARRKDGLMVFYFIADPAIFDLCETVCGSLQKRLDAHARAFG